MIRFDKPEYVIDNDAHLIRWNPTPAQVIARQVAESIANDREGKIRQALIDLGWTPPPDA